MKTPIIIKFAIWSQALPAIAYVLAPVRSPAAAAIVLGSLVSVLANVVGWWVGDLFGNNHVVSYVSSPVTAAFYLWALAEWQVTARERTVVRWSVLPFILIWMVLVAFVENVRGFDLVTAPVYSFGLLLAALWTVVRRWTTALQTPILTTDWFWITIGLGLNGAVTGLAAPMGGLLFARNELELFSLVWQLRAAAVTTAFTIISYGIYRGPLMSKFTTTP
jgi:hypothetical protein